MRQQIAAANWKMNLTLDQAEHLLDEILKAPHDLQAHQKVVFAVPFPYLPLAQQKISGKLNLQPRKTAIHKAAAPIPAKHQRKCCNPLAWSMWY